MKISARFNLLLLGLVTVSLSIWIATVWGDEIANPDPIEEEIELRETVERAAAARRALERARSRLESEQLMVSESQQDAQSTTVENEIEALEDLRTRLKSELELLKETPTEGVGPGVAPVVERTGTDVQPPPEPKVPPVEEVPTGRTEKIRSLTERLRAEMRREEEEAAMKQPVPRDKPDGVVGTPVPRTRPGVPPRVRRIDTARLPDAGAVAAERAALEQFRKELRDEVKNWVQAAMKTEAPSKVDVEQIKSDLRRELTEQQAAQLETLVRQTAPDLKVMDSFKEELTQAIEKKFKDQSKAQEAEIIKVREQFLADLRNELQTWLKPDAVTADVDRQFLEEFKVQIAAELAAHREQYQQTMAAELKAEKEGLQAFREELAVELAGMQKQIKTRGDPADTDQVAEVRRILDVTRKDLENFKDRTSKDLESQRMAGAAQWSEQTERLEASHKQMKNELVALKSFRKQVESEIQDQMAVDAKRMAAEQKALQSFREELQQEIQNLASFRKQVQEDVTAQLAQGTGKAKPAAPDMVAYRDELKKEVAQLSTQLSSEIDRKIGSLAGQLNDQNNSLQVLQQQFARMAKGEPIAGEELAQAELGIMKSLKADMKDFQRELRVDIEAWKVSRERDLSRAASKEELNSLERRVEDAMSRLNAIELAALEPGTVPGTGVSGLAAERDRLTEIRKLLEVALEKEYDKTAAGRAEAEEQQPVKPGIESLTEIEPPPAEVEIIEIVESPDVEDFGMSKTEPQPEKKKRGGLFSIFRRSRPEPTPDEPKEVLEEQIFQRLDTLKSEQEPQGRKPPSAKPRTQYRATLNQKADVVVEKEAADTQKAHPIRAPVREKGSVPEVDDTGREGDTMKSVRRRIDALILSLGSEVLEEPALHVPADKAPLARAKKTPRKPEEGWTYDGDWQNGLMHGQGTLVYPDHRRYVGEWVEGRREGHGTLVHADGWKFVGEWKQSRIDGHGTLTYQDGWQYVGEWSSGFMNGHGALRHPDGWEFVGQWANSQMEGQGTMMYTDGWRFAGMWKDGKRHGQGTLEHPDGWKYVGTWQNGLRSGEGDLAFADGWKYVGGWKKGKMNGAGELIHPEGWSYRGAWRRGRMEGAGTIVVQSASIR